MTKLIWMCVVAVALLSESSVRADGVSDPATYPDAEGFADRRARLVRALAEGSLDRWRRGFFAGGDPGKYLPPHAMAKLLVNADDPEPRQYMNDDRSYREHYHFAAVNWARFYPLYGEKILNDQTKARFAEQQRKFAYLGQGGTENHKTMSWTSAAVLPWYTGAGTDNLSKDETLDRAKQRLREYVKGLYYAGQGEWDSSTYLAFTVDGLLNIYDFSKDEEARLIARAGLDLLVSGYALKYTDGVFCAPNQRGFAAAPHASIADHLGYLWWGSSNTPTPEQMYNFRHAIHAMTSTWRPNGVITNIARKKLESLPGEQRNSKANYWHGQGIEPRAGASHESVWVTPHLTMGSLWDAHASQHTRFMIVAADKNGGKVFSGGHPRRSDHTGKKTDLGHADGTGRYVQSVQVGPTYLCMAMTPENETPAYTYFRYPDDLEPRRVGEWYVFDVGESRIAVRGVGAAGALAQTEPEAKGPRLKLIRFDGQRSGFLAITGDRSLDDQLAKVRLDASRYAADGIVSYVTPDGRSLSATFNPDPAGDRHGDRAANVTIDGRPVRLDDWHIYDGPWVNQTPGVLSVNDGRDGFVIDFTGELPVYKQWTNARGPR